MEKMNISQEDINKGMSFSNDITELLKKHNVKRAAFVFVLSLDEETECKQVPVLNHTGKTLSSDLADLLLSAHDSDPEKVFKFIQLIEKAIPLEFVKNMIKKSAGSKEVSISLEDMFSHEK